VRLWTLHPKHLDRQGLVALWRETLLAREVLRGRTRGYRCHPALARFRSHRTPLSAVNAYLAVIHDEALARGYSFDRSKLVPARGRVRIVATTGQLEHEWRHLRRKLRRRSPMVYNRCRRQGRPEAAPVFRIVPGPVEAWERVERRRAAETIVTERAGERSDEDESGDPELPG